MVKLNSKQLNLRVSAEALARWKAAANAEKRTLTNFVEFILDDYLKKQRRKEAHRGRESE